MSLPLKATAIRALHNAWRQVYISENDKSPILWSPGDPIPENDFEATKDTDENTPSISFASIHGSLEISSGSLTNLVAEEDDLLGVMEVLAIGP